jgi:anti-sigma B factor antagonist
VSEPLYELRSSRRGEAFVVEVDGEIDLGTSGEFEDVLVSLPRDVTRVVVDLAAITFLDSSALNVLVRQEKELTARGVELTLVIPPATPAAAIFQLTHLTETFTIVPTVEQAVA